MKITLKQEKKKGRTLVATWPFIFFLIVRGKIQTLENRMSHRAGQTGGGGLKMLCSKT